MRWLRVLQSLCSHVKVVHDDYPYSSSNNAVHGQHTMSCPELSPLCVYGNLSKNIVLIMAPQQKANSAEDKEGENVCIE